MYLINISLLHLKRFLPIITILFIMIQATITNILSGCSFKTMQNAAEFKKKNLLKREKHTLVIASFKELRLFYIILFTF